MSLMRRNPKNPNEVISGGGFSYDQFGYDDLEIEEHSENDGFGMIITYEVEDFKEWRKHKNERQITISQFADYLCEYCTMENNIVALSFFVTFQDKMKEQIKDNSEMIKQMASHGVKIETIEIFYDLDASYSSTFLD